MAQATGTLRITLTKSRIGACPKVRKTLAALGLRRLHQTVERPANDSIRGMVRTVAHLVETEQV